MDDDRLPERARAQPPSKRERAAAPAHRVDRPVHAAGVLRFTHSPSREELWQRLSTTVWAKVEAKLGDLIEWWANLQDGRVAVVALGTRALVAADPTSNAQGRRLYSLTSVPLDPGSFRHTRVTEAGRPSPPGHATRTTGPGAGPGGAGHRFGVSESMAGFLGNLPARAQQLLQEPFRSDTSLQYAFHAFQPGSPHGLGGTTLQAWCYLTDRRTVTFAAGVGAGYAPATGARSWDLICWRAERGSP